MLQYIEQFFNQIFKNLPGMVDSEEILFEGERKRPVGSMRYL